MEFVVLGFVAARGAKVEGGAMSVSTTASEVECS